MAIAVIDPGHGGKIKVGGSSPNNAKGPKGLLEKAVTLDIAQRVCSMLKKSAIDARLTRSTDDNKGLQERAEIAKDANADAFVSIHLNGFNGSAQGTETWHHSSASGDSKALAALVQKAVQKATGHKDRGIKANGFGVLQPSHHAKETAACLVEVSFMDVPSEEVRLRDDGYKDRIAAALAGAIHGWLIADGRMAKPESLASYLEATIDDGALPEDGYEAERMDSARASEPVAPSFPATGRSGSAPRPEVDQRRSDLAMSVDFLVPVREPEPAAAAGIDDLGTMLRGWRKERLCPPSATDVVPEKAVGLDESLEAVFVDLLAKLRLAVGIIRTEGINYEGNADRWSGTGFLVAPNILLTNHHVLNSVAAAEAAQVVFDYEISVQALTSGRKQRPPAGRSYRLRPDRLFVTSPFSNGLDYTFVWIDDVQLADGSLIRMERAAFSIQRNERAFIIHHPNGEPKRVSLDDADIVAARTAGAVIHYTSDTEPGSSGAPVIDRSGRLIALHHASRPNDEQIQTKEGQIPEYLNEGIKMAAIALDLENRRAADATAMIDIVLGEIYGSDTLAGFFGAAGRQIADDEPGAERVVQIYHATAQDIDVGFWNIEWFANRYHEKVDEVASMMVDLGLDIWALVETSPAATKALADAIKRKFGLRLGYAHSEPKAGEWKQSTAVLWNPTTVRGRQVPWPDEIEALFRMHSADLQPESRPDPKAGKIFDRYPALFHFEGIGNAAGRINFNLVPLHLKAMDDGWQRRQQASYILARAVNQMIQHHQADQDWVLGGDFNAELASGDFKALVDTRFTPLSAQDEADGALSYLKKPKSLIDHIFLSPNMARLYGPQDFFILAKEKSQVEYLKRFSDHRPVLLRLSARSGADASERHMPLDARLAAHVDGMLRRSPSAGSRAS